MKKNKLQLSELKGKKLTTDQQLQVKGGTMAMARPSKDIIRFDSPRIEDIIDIRKPLTTTSNKI